MLRKSRVCNFIVSFIVSFIGADSQVVLLALAIQRRRVDPQSLGGLIQGPRCGEDGTDMGLFQLIQA
ncbi:hypothetical protein D3C73_1651260 [compost metagenome]